MKISKKAIFIIIFILILIAVDEIIPNTIKIELVENKGGAFGIGDNSTFTFIITNVIVLGIILRFMMLQSSQLNKAQYVFLSLILAGGLSNLADRIIRGYVVDFIKLNIKFPVINLADMYIFIGWVLLVAVFAKHSYNQLQERKRNAEQK